MWAQDDQENPEVKTPPLLQAFWITWSEVQGATVSLPSACFFPLIPYESIKQKSLSSFHSFVLARKESLVEET